MLKKQYQKNKSTCKVTFTLPTEALEAKEVRVLGEFNDWNWEKGVTMKATNGEFKAIVELPVGRNYQFRYMADNGTWTNDAKADNYLPTPFGVENSVVFVDEISDVPAAKATTTITKKVVPAAKKATPVAKKATTTITKKAVPAAKKTVPANKATTTITKKAVPAAKKTVPANKATTTITKKAVPAAKKTVPVAKKTVPVAKKAIPVAKKTVPANKATTTITKKVTKAVKKDNLTKIEGIGPKIASLLIEAGIITFKDLSVAKLVTLETILKNAGPRFKMHKPTTWAEQAGLAANGQWDVLKKLQDELDGGKRK